MLEKFIRESASSGTGTSAEVRLSDSGVMSWCTPWDAARGPRGANKQKVVGFLVGTIGIPPKPEVTPASPLEPAPTADADEVSGCCGRFVRSPQRAGLTPCRGQAKVLLPMLEVT